MFLSFRFGNIGHRILRKGIIMFKILRVACSVIAAILVAVCIFIFLYVNITAGFICVAGALFFFVLTMLFKYLQEEKEELARKKSAPAEPADPDNTSCDNKKN